MVRYFFILLCLFTVSIQAFGQDNVVPLKEAIEQLEKQYQITISHDDEVAQKLRVSLPSSDDLATLLKALEAQTGLSFTDVGGSTYLMKSNSYAICLRAINESGKALDRAQIILNNKITNITTDIEGYARFDTKLTYQDTVKIYYFGYDTKKLLAGALINKNCPEIELVFGETTLREVVITNYITSGIDFSKDNHSLQIRTDDLALLPGETDGDILLAIKTLPGITSPNGKAGNLHVRGSTTDQTLILFDNIPIYHKGHYFGAISPYNPIAIDEITVYRSGYGPDLGGRVGGAIELESSKSIPDSTLFGVGLNSYYGSAFAEIPINRKVGMSASFRSSYPGHFQSPKLKALNKLALQNSITSKAEENPDMEIVNNSFIFQDANLSTNYKINNGSISLSLLNIRNLQEGEIFNKTRNSTLSVTNKLDNRGANLDWSHYWSPKFNTAFSSTYSDYEYESIIEENPVDRPSFIPNQFSNRIKDLFLNVQGNVILNPEKNTLLNLGYQVNRHLIEGFTYSNRPNDAEVSIREENNAYLHSLFVNNQLKIGNKLNINGGIRGNYYSLTENIRVEPRIFVNWQLRDNFSLKSSYGLYSQYITQNVYFDFEDTKVENLTWELASEAKPIVKSNQWMAGATWTPKTILVDVEFYHKSIDDLSTLKTGKSPIDPDRFAIGTLESYGVDVLLKKKWGKLDTWVSYSYIHTEMDFPALNLLTFETYYDQPHTVNINATMPYKNWSFSIGWQYQSGVPIYTNNTFFPVPGPSPTPQPDQPEAQQSEGRFPSQHQLDLAVVYKFPENTKPWNGSIGFSLLNAYNRDNLVAENYLTFGANTSLEQRYSIGFAPNIMLNIRW